MFIHNKDKRVVGLALSVASKLKHPNVDHLALKPGVNEVDQELWDEVKGTKVAQHLVKSGKLEVMGGGKAKASLAELTAEEALELVSQTLDRDLLNGFAEEEKRKPVLKAIKDQLEKVKVGKKKDEETEE